MRTRRHSPTRRASGFTMIELLIGSAVMLVAVLGALLIYSRSNKVSVEQQMVTEVQNDVRSSMFFVTRDLRMAGAGLPEEFSGYFIEGRGQRGPGRRGHARPGDAHGQHRGPPQPAHPELPGLVGRPRRRGLQLRAVSLSRRLLRQPVRHRPAQSRVRLLVGRGPDRHPRHPQHGRGQRAVQLLARAGPRDRPARGAVRDVPEPPTITTAARSASSTSRSTGSTSPGTTPA